ncbi:hypothetical protein ACH5RR_000734 [Cinchona calisaya]|uniref:Uncharacterized protein n=1 Tax=Cinchona calisaya TaxID=153742 RepID=A0ABD3B1K1_9GENT
MGVLVGPVISSVKPLVMFLVLEPPLKMGGGRKEKEKREVTMVKKWEDGGRLGKVGMVGSLELEKGLKVQLDHSNDVEVGNKVSEVRGEDNFNPCDCFVSSLLVIATCANNTDNNPYDEVDSWHRDLNTSMDAWEQPDNEVSNQYNYLDLSIYYDHNVSTGLEVSFVLDRYLETLDALPEVVQHLLLDYTWLRHYWSSKFGFRYLFPSATAVSGWRYKVKFLYSSDFTVGLGFQEQLGPLYHPIDVPGNTGCIARTYAASAVRLHLVEIEEIFEALTFQSDMLLLKCMAHRISALFQTTGWGKWLLAFTKRGSTVHSAPVFLTNLSVKLEMGGNTLMEYNRLLVCVVAVPYSNCDFVIDCRKSLLYRCAYAPFFRDRSEPNRSSSALKSFLWAGHGYRCVRTAIP